MARILVVLICLVTLFAGCAHVPGTGNTFTSRTAKSILKGTDALLARQHDDGSWGGDEVINQDSHKSDYPVPISSLAYLALMTATASNRNLLLFLQLSLRSPGSGNAEWRNKEDVPACPGKSFS